MAIPDQAGALEAALTTGAPLALWAWATLSRGQIGAATSRQLMRDRLHAVSASLVALAVIAGLAPWVSAVTPPAVVGLAAALAFLAREIRDPMRPKLWHHRRVRPFGVAGALVVSAALATFLPLPALAPLLMAAAAYHRHLAGAQSLFNQSLEEIDALAKKVQALEAALRLERARYVEAELDVAPQVTTPRSLR